MASFYDWFTFSFLSLDLMMEVFWLSMSLMFKYILLLLNLWVDLLPFFAFSVRLVALLVFWICDGVRDRFDASGMEMFTWPMCYLEFWLRASLDLWLLGIFPFFWLAPLLVTFGLCDANFELPWPWVRRGENIPKRLELLPSVFWLGLLNKEAIFNILS